MEEETATSAKASILEICIVICVCVYESESDRDGRTKEKDMLASKTRYVVEYASLRSKRVTIEVYLCLRYVVLSKTRDLTSIMK
jgi:hypothetical protein